MKKIFYLFIIFTLLSCNINYKKYKITDISMREISLKDSMNSSKRYYLICFQTEWKSPAISLLGGGVESGLEGSIDSIRSIQIYSKNNKIITSYFKGWNLPLSGKICTADGEVNYISFLDLEKMINSINKGCRESIGVRIKYSHLFYTRSDAGPHKIIINFSNRKVSSKIQFNEEKCIIESSATNY